MPKRAEEIHQRLITALHLSGDFNESDKMCAQFLERYPQSTLLPQVLFRQAENSYFRMLAAEKASNNPKELTKLQDEAIRRYSAIVEKYPDYADRPGVFYDLGTALSGLGRKAEARLYYERVISEFPKSDYATQARRRLDQMKTA